jgi:hypothetical protein
MWNMGSTFGDVEAKLRVSRAERVNPGFFSFVRRFNSKALL